MAGRLILQRVHWRGLDERRRGGEPRASAGSEEAVAERSFQPEALLKERIVLRNRRKSMGPPSSGPSNMGAFEWQNEKARTRCNRAFQTLYLAGFLVITLFVTKPETLVILGQYINGLINTPLIMFGICWIAFHTDRRLRMGRVTAVLLLATVVVIVACLAIGIYSQMGN